MMVLFYSCFVCCKYACKCREDKCDEIDWNLIERKPNAICSFRRQWTSNYIYIYERQVLNRILIVSKINGEVQSNYLCPHMVKKCWIVKLMRTCQAKWWFQVIEFSETFREKVNYWIEIIICLCLTLNYGDLEMEDLWIQWWQEVDYNF